MAKRPENERSDDLTVPTTDTAELPDAGGFADTSDAASTEVETSEAPAPAPEGTAADSSAKPSVAGSIAGSTWVGLSVGAVILILLLIFILQNQDSVQLKMFVWEWNFPIGVGMLIAAIAGALVMSCVGAVRILQLRRQINHPDNGGKKMRK